MSNPSIEYLKRQFLAQCSASLATREVDEVVRYILDLERRLEDIEVTNFSMGFGPENTGRSPTEWEGGR